MPKAFPIYVLISSIVIANFSAAFMKPTIGAAEKPMVVLLMDSETFQKIRDILEGYAQDLENEGFSVKIVEINKLQDNTPYGIRCHLREIYQDGLVGAVFIGDIPAAWYEVDGKIFPTDMYYQDLDGLWVDKNDNGIYDEHVGNITPEIWTSRLTLSTLNDKEAKKLKDYFNRDHLFRNGLRMLPWWRTLAYIDDDGVEWVEEARDTLSQVSTEIIIINDKNITTAKDFKSKLRDQTGYQWLYLMAHGSFDYHVFEVNNEPTGGTVYTWEYETIDPRICFYLFFTCSAARYTEQDYLAQSAVFKTSHGLLAIGCTDDMFSISFRKFFELLNEGKSVGDALNGWFQDQYAKLNPIVFHGLTIIGDPTLRPYAKDEIKIHNLSISSVSINSQNKGSLLISINVKNRGNFTEHFEIVIKCYSDKLIESKLKLEPHSQTVLNFSINKPYKILHSKGVGSVLTISLETTWEEFDLNDNVEQICLNDIAIIKSEATFSPHTTESIIIIFSIAILSSYTFFKLLSGDFLLEKIKKRWGHIKT